MSDVAFNAAGGFVLYYFSFSLCIEFVDGFLEFIGDCARLQCSVCLWYNVREEEA